MTTGGWIVSIVWMLIVAALLVWLLVWLYGSRRPADPRGRTDGGSAADILDRRLARGELSVEEYERIRAALHARSQQAGPDGHHIAGVSG